MEKYVMKIGFIGQGYIGKNYADDFEKRGFEVIRYALEEAYKNNKEKISECDIVFIAVPTPTTPQGFDDHIVREAVGLVGRGKIAVIKSTMVPGSTVSIQEQYPDQIVLCSPEFLSEATAAHDAANPFSNIIGIPKDTEEYRNAAQSVHTVLAPAPFSLTAQSEEAETIKYAHNLSGYVQIVLFNIFYDLVQKFGGRWDVIQKALEADPFISNRYAKPLHKSGRGAGGHCFIKDFEAFRRVYEARGGDQIGLDALTAIGEKNIDLLLKTRKDLDLLSGVYGEGILEQKP